MWLQNSFIEIQFLTSKDRLPLIDLNIWLLKYEVCKKELNIYLYVYIYIIYLYLDRYRYRLSIFNFIKEVGC